MKSENTTFEKEEILELVGETGASFLDGNDDDNADGNVGDDEEEDFAMEDSKDENDSKEARAYDRKRKFRTKWTQSENAIRRLSRLAQIQRRSYAQMDTRNFLVVIEDEEQEVFCFEQRVFR